jgi:hypothetical protein
MTSNEPSLYENFMCYTKGIKSPECFIESAYYWMIGAALQRRVWLHNHEAPIFPNLYIGLCGGPGVGKGIILKPTIDLIQYHKLASTENSTEKQLDKMLSGAAKGGTTPETILLLQQAKEAMAHIKDAGEQKKTGMTEEKLLFPVGADSTTFASIVQQHGQAVRIFHTNPCPMAPSGIYTYHSLILTLQEASSLFEKNAKQVVDYLLHAYDCSDYKYKTKTQGTDIIKRSSLSLLFGTTPDFIRSAFTDQLLGEGFSSRTIFVYGKDSRFENWRIAEFTPDQQVAKNKILVRLKELSKAFGQCRMSPEACKFMDEYFIGGPYKNEMTKADPKLQHYFARKNLHVQKLALCIHFGDSDSMEIPLDPFLKAFNYLARMEENMIYCLNTKSQNPAGELSRRVLKYIKELGAYTGVTLTEIVIRFADDANMELVEEALKLLIMQDKVKQVGQSYKLK